MSQMTLNRIKRALEDQFKDLIDMSDWEKRPAEHLEGAFLSRALAALAIKQLSGADPAIAAASVVDGFDDLGLDAIHFDAISDILYVVQSKWSGNGRGSFDEGSISKFTNGIKALLNGEFSRFNDRVRAKEAELSEALYASREIQIRILTVHTAAQPLAAHVRRPLDDLLRSINNPVPVAEHTDFDQAEVYGLITAETKDPKITIQAVLTEWGMIETPYLAYYGRIQLSQIREWWRAHRNKLFSRNLRLFYQSSAVNDALRKTLIEDPSSFWYYNNGITIISDKVIKGIAGFPPNKFGNFTCEGASVVNGAQTVGTVGNALDVEDDSEDPESWVLVRLISLEKAPPHFDQRITRAANLQNAVGTREFAAMDPRQHRIATEFALDKRRYVYKSGEVDPRGEEGCGLGEATQALGSAVSVAIAVQVKREIGSIWGNTEAAPYTEIFTDNVGSTEVWRAVTVMRAVDDELQRLKSSDVSRAEHISAHMNRIILYLVHQDPQVRAVYNDPNANGELVVRARKAVEPIYRKVAEYLLVIHPSDYLAVFCKNTEKCEDLVQSVLGGNHPAHPEGDDLFAHLARFEGKTS